MGNLIWDNYEPAPLEFLHVTLMDLFHSERLGQKEGLSCKLDGSQMNSLIAKAKCITYDKYPETILTQNVVPKERFLK